MKIKVNSVNRELNPGNSLIDLMCDLSMNEKDGIAVAVNSNVIPKKDWMQFELKEEDEVIIIEAAQGG